MHQKSAKTKLPSFKGNMYSSIALTLKLWGKQRTLVTNNLDTSVWKCLSYPEIQFMNLPNNHIMKAVEGIIRQ